ncbi:Sugar (and other) transporter [Geosmithia morbida]|uniref:Sugar (And other) transporter n=1 Tax=Geosmithia morbida TaxID=1094350 RepID=A0A9P5CZ49_9HYPO|nr:Sugar (and other) transporter [Geosmithia morbida]KAF4120062.1 Sugar (and other) transporter [Geosmithia morbida]
MYTCTLHIGNKRHSSWSMRPWVLLKAPDIHFSEQLHLFISNLAQPQFGASSKTIPRPKTFARCAASEMRPGLSAIREEWSMNVALRIGPGPQLSDVFRRETRRLDVLFAQAIDSFGGPWLAGAHFTFLDAFFAPAAYCIKTYGIELEGSATEYMDHRLHYSTVRAWVEDGVRRKSHPTKGTAGRDALLWRVLLNNIPPSHTLPTLLSTSILPPHTVILPNDHQPTSTPNWSFITRMSEQGFARSLRDITAYLVIIVSISTAGSLQYGFHMAELNAPQDVITCRKKSIWSTGFGTLPQCIPMDEAAFATVSSMFTLGGLLGALGAGPFSSRNGRLASMRLASLFYIMGSAVETFSPSATPMAVGRFAAGAAAGASTVIVPLYISEIAPPDMRGLFGFMTQVSINVGILIAQSLGYFLSHGSSWRWILGIGACLASAQSLGTLVIPESPAWLAANGSVTAAKKVLQRIRGGSVDIKDEVRDWSPSPEESGEEQGLLSPPEEEIAHQRTIHMGFIDVVRDPRCRPAIVAVVGVMFAQQFCGINSIIMYSVSLLANLLPISSALLTIIISAVNLATTLACSPLPDRLGRKTCLMLSIIGQGFSSFILALSIVSGIKVLSAISVLFFVGFFAVGLGPVPFILASELVPQEAVGATQSWCLGANYVATFIVAQFFPIINTELNNTLGGQGWVYFLFAIMAAISAIFVLSAVPETKGKGSVDDVWGREESG